MSWNHYLLKSLGKTQKILLLQLFIDYQTRILMLLCLNIAKIVENFKVKISYVSIYSLSDLGVSRNLIGLQ